MNCKKIMIKDDPWSLSFIDRMKDLSRYKTTMLWKENIDIPIQETPYYQKFLMILQKQGTIWNGIINSDSELIKQCLNFKNMFINTPNWKTYNPPIIYHADSQMYFGDFTAIINEHGEIILHDGHHRIACLLAHKMPLYVNVCMTANNIQKLHNDIVQLYNGSIIYQPIVHPFFNDLQASRDNSQEDILRKIIIKFNISSVLDCGICHGYTLYTLRDLIRNGTGLEYNQTRYEISKLIFDKIGFQCYKEPIIDFILNTNLKYDAVFCLNVLHHIIKESGKEGLNSLLLKIKTNTKYFIYSLPESHESQFMWMGELRNTINKYIRDQLGFNQQEIYPLKNRKIIVLFKG